ncbi:hypothetical protein ACH420_43585, partial [Streptomyces griseoruber]
FSPVRHPAMTHPTTDGATLGHACGLADVVTGEQLDRLARGDVAHLADAVVRAEQPSWHGKFGMCGRLDVYSQG